MTTIEKMARAIWDDRESRKRSQKPWEDARPEDAEDCRLNARAALQAIRVPDAGMIEAGESAAWDKSNSMPTIRAMPIGFTAMIDAILSEQPEP